MKHGGHAHAFARRLEVHRTRIRSIGEVSIFSIASNITIPCDIGSICSLHLIGWRHIRWHPSYPAHSIDMGGFRHLHRDRVLRMRSIISRATSLASLPKTFLPYGFEVFLLGVGRCAGWCARYWSCSPPEATRIEAVVALWDKGCQQL